MTIFHVFIKFPLYLLFRFLEGYNQPRTSFDYNNLMFNLLGYITEELSGVKWEELIKREVFDQLDMSNSSFLAVFPEDLELASFYMIDGDSLRKIDWQTVFQLNGEDVSPSGETFPD